ncbi:MAG: chromate efflux transporter [Pseudomonadota bacterium]|nr:chromate efflux transporter [Pseudomonadota bacterium]
MNDAHPAAGQRSLSEVMRTFARIGVLSFGGPAGQIALMHRVLVEEKGWLDERRFLHALNYCMLLPGPEAMQLATYCGWLVRGVRGGLVAGLLFVLPGAAVIIALTAMYMALGQAPMVQGLLFGLKAAVLAIVLEALIRVAKRAVGGFAMGTVSVAAFVAIAFFKVPFPLIVATAALAGAVLHWLVPPHEDGEREDALAQEDRQRGDRQQSDWQRADPGRLIATAATWLAIWFLPLILLVVAAGTSNVFAAEGVFFSKMATVTFGGAYAVLAYVAQQAVEVHGWLRPDEMLTGLGLAETTPGPLILVLVFVGFLGGARLSGLEPFTGGLIGAVVTLWFTFVPCFLWIFAGAPYVEQVRNVRWLAAALAGVTAAVVGVIANLALWFGMHVLFGEVGEARLGILTLPVPVPGSFDWAAAVIAAVAAVALLRFHASMFLVLGAAAGLGMVLAG